MEYSWGIDGAATTGQHLGYNRATYRLVTGAHQTTTSIGAILSIKLAKQGAASTPQKGSLKIWFLKDNDRLK